MGCYKAFASVYDIFTKNVNYRKRTSYICKLFKKYDKMPSLLLDVACGTGNFSLEFAARGVSVIGADMSEDMLSVATEKSSKRGADILFLCQRAEELELYGTVDGAVCLLDSINHITDYDTLKKAFGRISLFLEKDRLFIFDVNTEYKHEEILDSNTFIYKRKGIYCIWQNEYDKKSKTTNISIEFSRKNHESCAESFSERFYSDEQLTAALEGVGLKVEAIFGENTFTAPKEKCQRKIFVTRKV